MSAARRAPRPTTRRPATGPATADSPGATRRIPASVASLALTLAIAASTGCAGPGLGSGPSRAAGALGWGAISLGMTLGQVEARTGREVELREIEGPCGNSGARLVDGESELFVAFSETGPGARLREIVRRLPRDASRESTARELRRRFPGLRYRPDPEWPDMPEEEDPDPVYVHPEIPDQGIRVDTRDGWMRIGYLRCLERGVGGTRRIPPGAASTHGP